ncbi:MULTISPECIES: hypothetical protein [Aquimarina]|uniref:hypothetical protein n=1 Tax=Aquimarina TaxID=290174 RepID=UPI000943AA10|nr:MULTISPECIES: hypothetical protein [Aquimarina]
MKKLIYRLQYLVLFPMFLGLLLISSCEKEDANNEPVEIVDTTNTPEKSFPFPEDPDFRPPRDIPSPPQIDATCVIRISYLSFLRRCPENQSVVTQWVRELNRRDVCFVTEQFIISNEAKVRWGNQYYSYLNRYNLTELQLDLDIYIAYRGLLLREPDVTGGIAWTREMKRTSLKAVVCGIMNSQEYQIRKNNMATECTNAANQCTY